jgi:hypothetical protein
MARGEPHEDVGSDATAPGAAAAHCGGGGRSRGLPGGPVGLFVVAVALLVH